MNLEEIDFKELPEDMQFCTINDLVAKADAGCNVIGYKSAEGNYIINPGGDIQIGPGSKLFVLGNPSQIRAFNNLFGIKIES